MFCMQCWIFLATEHLQSAVLLVVHDAFLGVGCAELLERIEGNVDDCIERPAQANAANRKSGNEAANEVTYLLACIWPCSINTRAKTVEASEHSLHAL